MSLALLEKSSLVRMTCCKNQRFTSPPPLPLGAYQGASLDRGCCSLPGNRVPPRSALFFSCLPPCPDSPGRKGDG